MIIFPLRRGIRQVSGYVLQGERDYQQIKGGTGPLVYPAGFLYVYAALRSLTNGAVLPAQIVFIGIYMLNQAVVLGLYAKAQVLTQQILVATELCTSLSQ